MTSPVFVLFLLLSAFLVLAAGLAEADFFFVGCETKNDQFIDINPPYLRSEEVITQDRRIHWHHINKQTFTLRVCLKSYISVYFLISVTVGVWLQVVWHFPLRSLLRRTRHLRWCPLSFYWRGLLGCRFPAWLGFGRLKRVCELDTSVFMSLLVKDDKLLISLFSNSWIVPLVVQCVSGSLNK